MNKNVRKLLDWLELPKTLFIFTMMPKEELEKAKNKMNNWNCEWRKNTLSFKIQKKYLDFISN